MVLYGVICTTVEHLGNICPFVSHAGVIEEENPFFFITPGNLLYLRIQMIMPSLTALLTNSSWQMFSNLSPLLWSMSLNQLKN